MRLIAAIAFLACSLNLPAQDNEGLIKSVMQGDLAAVQAAVAAGANVNYLSPSGATPLAVAFYSPEITQFLVDKGADPNLGDSPALFHASRTFSVDVMRILLKAGADPNRPLTAKVDQVTGLQKVLDAERAKGKSANGALVKTYEGMIDKAKKAPPIVITSTPIAAVYNSTNCRTCAELLLAAGARVDAIDATGRNLAHSMAFTYIGGTQRVRMIQGNTPNMQAAGFRIPDWYHNLDPATQGTPGEMLALLVAKGVNIRLVDKIGLSPMSLALMRDSLVTSELLLGLITAGSDPLEDDPRRGSVIVRAASYGSPEVIAALVAKGADVDHEDNVQDGKESWKGYTALMNAANRNNLATVRYLIEHGAKVGPTVNGTGSVYSFKSKVNCEGYDVKNKSVLYFAIETGSLEMVKFLVEAPGLDWRGVKPMEYKEFKGMTHTLNVSDFGNKCFSFGVFNPQGYAKRLGLTEILDYLKAKRID